VRSVLQVVTSTDRRGAELFAIRLGVALREIGWAARPIALAPGHGPAHTDLPTLGSRPLGLATLRALRAEMRAADVTIAHGSRTLPATALAGLGTRAPVVYRNIGDTRFWASTKSRQVRTSWAIRRARAVVAISDDSARAIVEHLRVPEARITVIPQGVELERFQPPTPSERARAREELGLPVDPPVIACIGALSPEKDPVLAVEVMRHLEDAHLLVAGEGPMRDAVETAGRQLPGRIHLIGNVGDLGACYAAADVVLLTSQSEGIPAVLIEAGLSAIPAVTTDVGYVRDVVIDGETGAVVPTRDPADISRALMAVLADRERMGAAARQRCTEHFDIDAIAHQWDAVLTAVLRG
jgi:glycosyltransferase involved in cell wall biosynthesis